MLTYLRLNSVKRIWNKFAVSATTAMTFSIALTFTTYTPEVNAWGQNGHRIVGQIAFNHLTPLAREKVLALLSGDKLPEVTTWADEMRSNPDVFWKKKSSRWHYISINKLTDFNPDEYDYPHHAEPKDIYSAILKNITVLSDSNASIKDKEFHLRFLTHLVGDLHMPLHVGRSEDRGGNRIKVKFFGESMNLHTLWDTKLIESQNLSYKDFAEFIDTNDTKQLNSILSTSVTDWVQESYTHSQTVYDIGDGDFGYAYQYQHMPLVKDQLLKAGVRLAGVLNQIFDPASESGKTAIQSFK